MNLAKAVAGRLRALDVESVIGRVETTLWGLQGKALRLANVLDPLPPFDRYDGYLEEDTFVEDVMQPTWDAALRALGRMTAAPNFVTDHDGTFRVLWRDPEPLTQESVERVTAAMRKPVSHFDPADLRIPSLEAHPFLEQVDEAVRQLAKAASDKRDADMRAFLGDVAAVAPDFDAEAILRDREEG